MCGAPWSPSGSCWLHRPVNRFDSDESDLLLTSGRRTPPPTLQRALRRCPPAAGSALPSFMPLGARHRAPIVNRPLCIGTARVAHMKIQPASVLGEDGVGHPPRLTQPQRRGEQPQLARVHLFHLIVTHGHTGNETATSPVKPPRRSNPHDLARSPRIPQFRQLPTATPPCPRHHNLRS